MNQVVTTTGHIRPITPAIDSCSRPIILCSLVILCSRVTATAIMAGVGVTDITGKATAKTDDMIATMIVMIMRTVVTTGIESGLRTV